MNKSSSTTTKHGIAANCVCKLVGVAFILASAFICHAQKNNTTGSDSDLLDSFVQAKGYNNIVQFSPSNIKQFWINKSVISKNDFITVMLLPSSNTKNESVLLPIKLINVDAAQDCKVEVISSTGNMDFSILNEQSIVLAKSNKEDNFINYNVSSATFHMDEASDFAFFIKFSSPEHSELQIRRVILSFDNNKDFLASPGILKVKASELFSQSRSYIESTDESSFKVTGTDSRIFSKKKILVSDNLISNSVTVKNICDKTVHIYFGYSPYTKDGKRIVNQNNPYKKINKILKVISADKDSNKIVVDAYSDWQKGCTFALDAKEDLSDFPNSSFVNGTIQEVNKIDDDHVEIVFDKTIGKDIKKGTPCRIQAPAGTAHLYTKGKDLQPGEEIELSSTIKKDDAFFQYSANVLCKGCYYVIPFVFSYTTGNTKEENTVLISDFTVSY